MKSIQIKESNWPNLIREKLGLPWSLQSKSGVPFALTGPILQCEEERPLSQVKQWRSKVLEVTRDSALFTAETPEGFQGKLHMRFFSDTRAVECWGEIANQGSETLKDVFEARILDLELGTAERGLGQAWIRTIHGVGHQPPGSFEPYDFAPEDRQLLRMDWGPSSARDRFRIERLEFGGLFAVRLDLR